MDHAPSRTAEAAARFTRAAAPDPAAGGASSGSRCVRRPGGGGGAGSVCRARRPTALDGEACGPEPAGSGQRDVTTGHGGRPGAAVDAAAGGATSGEPPSAATATTA